MKTTFVLLAAALAASSAAAQQISGTPLVEQLRSSFDVRNGGFGGTPKVVQPLEIDFLLREGARGNRQARDMAVTTLLQMQRSAIHDQVGGGFFHEALDSGWRVPRLDKTLEDQALLTIAFTEAWQLTGEPAFRRTAVRTLDYVLRDLREKNGVFDAGQSPQSLAPVGGAPTIVTGRFYGWEMAEVRHLLGKKADLPIDYYGLKERGNVPESLDPNGDLKGLNLLSAVRTDTEVRTKFGLKQEDLVAALDAALAKLQLIRSHRPQPKRDGTISTYGNALMISALARAGAAFDDARYAYEAGQTLRFLESSMYEHRSGRLLHTAGSGDLASAADFAAFVQAVLDVYEVSLDPRWLKLSLELQQHQDERFWDGAGLRYAGAGSAGDAMAARNLLRLAAITGSAPWQAKSEAIFRSYAAQMESSPRDIPAMVAVAASKPVKVVVLIGDASSDQARSLLRAARESFEPPRALLFASGRGNADPLAAYAPVVAQMRGQDVPSAAVCESQSCRTPTVDAQKLAAYLGR